MRIYVSSRQLRASTPSTCRERHLLYLIYLDILATQCERIRHPGECSRTQMQLPFIFQAWKCPNTYYIFLLWQKPLNASQVLRSNAGTWLMKDWLTKIHRAGELSPSARGAQEMAGQKWRDFPYQPSFTMRSLWGRYKTKRSFPSGWNIETHIMRQLWGRWSACSKSLDTSNQPPVFQTEHSQLA